MGVRNEISKHESHFIFYSLGQQNKQNHLVQGVAGLSSDQMQSKSETLQKLVKLVTALKVFLICKKSNIFLLWMLTSGTNADL